MKKIVLVLSFGLFLTGCGKAPSKAKDETKASSVTQVSSTSETSTQKEETKEMEVFEAGSLIQAVMNNDIEFTKRILEDKTYNINEVNQQNESALLIAAHNNFVEIAKVLIDHGADVNQQDNIQDSPYLYAGAQGKTEILAYMLKNSQPNQQIYNRFGGNTIIPAAEKGHLDTVKLLLEDGTVDINHQNNYGYTALIEAIALTDGSKVYQDIVAELLKYGADKNLKDNYGKTATDYARELGYGNILKMLENQ